MDLFSRLFGAPVPTLNALEVNEKLKQGQRPLILDVRQPEEFRGGHIAGAKQIPLGELGGRLKELPAGREIICVCHTGSRSVPAARKLLEAGYQVFNLQGGMLAWERSRLPVKKGSA